MTASKTMSVAVVRGNKYTLEVRPIVNVVKEQFKRVGANGQILESTARSRQVPMLFLGEVEHIAVNGQSTIVQVR